MHHIKEHEVDGERYAPPYERIIKHLASPWTMGTTNLWMGISEVHVGSTSNLHAHDDTEEIFYVVSGRGAIRVGDEREAIEPGSCVYVPIGYSHQLINTGDETLKVVCAASPPFHADKFDDVHKPG